MLNKNPLVSIVVVTYNSSKFVVDTLESAKEQSYENVELIVTDDCSTDNTVEICREWLKTNRNRFVNSQIITTEKNTGISPNSNRGLKASKGEWIKFIAGDDMLTPDCIEELVSFLNNNKNLPLTFVVHGIIPFKNGTNFKVVFPPEKVMQYDAHHQLRHFLKRGNCVSGSAFFLERETLLNFGGFNERYTLYEDFPLLIKYTENNHKIWLCRKPLVKYRIHESNISFESSFLLKKSNSLFKKEILHPLLIRHKLFLTHWHRLIMEKKEKNVFWAFLFIFSPIGWISRIYSIFGLSYFYNHKIEFQKEK